jgi:asparaginyl-tRNA synthetase
LTIIVKNDTNSISKNPEIAMRILVKHVLQESPSSQKVTVKGWVRTMRENKGFSFIELNDGSCLSSVQVIIDNELDNYDTLTTIISTGASIEVTGTIIPSQGGKQAIELKALSCQVIGESPADSYPLQKKRHTLEKLREMAHLRPRTNTIGAVTRVRNAISYAIHTFFQERDFFYINTPIITASDCEGAGEMFQVTTLPLENIPLDKGNVDWSRDFFGRPSSLTVSGQLEGEIYACALSNIYTFGPTFRAEKSNTSRHLAEFWMVEPETAFCDINGNMDLAEDFLKYLFNYVLKNCREDITFFNSFIDDKVISTLEGIAGSSFQRVTYTEAVEELIKCKRDFSFPVSWGIDLQSEHEKYLTEEVYKGPVIVTDYPKEIKAFYMKENDDGKTVRAMDVLVPRLGEIIGGSERENRYEVLMKKITSQGLDPDDYWWYLDLRRYGSVPHSGFGLGLERTVQFITGMQNIRDVIPFPRTPNNIGF